MASTPRIILQTGPVTRRAGKRSRSRCSSSRRALRRQGAAKHKRRKAASRQALLVFRSLDPLPRAPGNLIAGDGAKNAFPRSEPRTGNNRKNYLTGKAPYKSDKLSVPQRQQWLIWTLATAARGNASRNRGSARPPRPSAGHRSAPSPRASPACRGRRPVLRCG